MDGSMCNSNNEKSFLKANGPCRLRSSGSVFPDGQHPQVVKTTKSITVGEIKIYGSHAAEETQVDKKVHGDWLNFFLLFNRYKC